MSKFFLLLWMFVLLSTAAQADSLSITFNNKSGQVVSAITATPKSGGVAQNLLTAAIAIAAKPKIIFVAPANVCVFSLSYTMANGKVTTLPDTDICQTDQIIIE